MIWSKCTKLALNSSTWDTKASAFSLDFWNIWSNLSSRLCISTSASFVSRTSMFASLRWSRICWSRQLAHLHFAWVRILTFLTIGLCSLAKSQRFVTITDPRIPSWVGLCQTFKAVIDLGSSHMKLWLRRCWQTCQHRLAEFVAGWRDFKIRSLQVAYCQTSGEEVYKVSCSSPSIGYDRGVILAG